MTGLDDRRVHAEDKLGQVVRYDRAGKWYYEPFDSKRIHVTISRAVDIAAHMASNGGKVYLGVPGGNTFDSFIISKGVRR